MSARPQRHNVNGAPTREGAGLNQFNDQLRANPEYRAFLASLGVNPDGALRLSGGQRSAAEAWVRQRTPQLSGKFQIDPAGNVNTDHGTSTAWSNPAFRYPLIAGAAIGTAGLINPALLGLGGVGGGGAAAGSAAGAGAGIGANSIGAAAALGAGATGGGAATGAGMAAGGGGFFSSLGKFFNSQGGATLIDRGGDLAGGWMQNRAQNRGADIAERSNAAALDFLKSQDARDYAEYLKERDRGWGLEDADRTRKYGYEDIDRGRKEEDRQLKMLREREREGRLAPFRQGAERGYQALSSLLFNPNQSMGRSMPVGNTGRASLADLLRS